MTFYSICNFHFEILNLQYLFFADWFQQHYALGVDGFFAADGADEFAGFGLQADAFGFDVEDFGQAFADCLAMGQQFWPLGEYDAIDIADFPAHGRHGIECRAEHFGRIAAAVVGSVSGNI